tara:strand:+ start:623 stop:1756 length:1134 start_codon:yes stop_codon:yes gene_type:complete
MIINTNNYSIAEVLEMLRRRQLIVNKDYQRGSGIWPQGARSYFIDTILNGYPFPKVYFYEYSDRADGFALKRELVDGQQRITAIQDFKDNKFRISGDSNFRGADFNSLSEEAQDQFLAYTVSADVIRNASRSEILQMFRRMNAYTLPLNEAEKRHSSYDGEFKWFVNEVSDELNKFFLEFGVFTNRQIVRMADAELITELVLAMESGIVSSSPTMLKEIYKKYDERFDGAPQVKERILGAIGFIGEHLQVLKRSHLAKPYALHSLALCVMHNKFDLETIRDQLKISGKRHFCESTDQTQESLLELAQAHEAKEIEGNHAAYVWGATAGTNRLPRRMARMVEIMRALGNPVEERLDADLTEGMPAAVRQASHEVAFSV